VTIRHALRDTINSQIPETKPINKVLGDNIEVRSTLRKRLGDVADDSTAANQQYQSELRKGQDQLQAEQNKSFLDEEYERRRSAVGRNKNIVKYGAALGAGAGLVPVAKQVIKNLVP
jgi:hypothetical protein